MTEMIATPAEAAWAICAPMFAPLAVWMVLVGICYLYEYFIFR